jgi:glutamate-ammonia-ligase adenylyltransferase
MRLARYGFIDQERAAALAGVDGLGLWDDAAQQPVDERASALLDTLAITADPDLALRTLDRLVEACRRTAGAGDPLEAMLDDPRLRRRLIEVLGVSANLGDLLVANPDEWQELRGEQNKRPAGYSTRVVDTVPALRIGYRRELLRIVAADLTRAVDVDRAMERLSELADATLQAGLDIATAEQPRHARACTLAVIAMGKCGGRELNYVSDVDVVFVCEPAEGVDTVDAMRAGSALAARMMEICGQVAWPVDAALRPEGSSGALVRTVASHVAYYTKWAKTWEFQALLKARPAAGDLPLGRRWLDELQPLIWSAAERPEAVEEIRRMRRRIIDAIPRNELDREIKRGPGGLRDIEFAVQLLQLVHGRADERLRSTGTIPTLRALIEGGYVGLEDGERLLRAYRFLRTVEHRLQLQRLQRTHTVPDDPAALRWLAQAMGHRSGPALDAVEGFRAEWVRHATEVRRLHAKLLYRPLLEAVARVPSDELRLTPDAAHARLVVLGFADPAGALRHIEALTGGLSRTAAIQRQLLPVLLSEFADAPEPDRGLLAYRQVSEKLGNTPWYLRVLRDEGPVALRLARLLSLSRYVTELLVRDPEALRLLADDAELVPRTREALVEGFAAAAGRHRDRETASNAVRAQRRRELFRIACADLLGFCDIDTVGLALANVTDATLSATLGVAMQLSTVDLTFAIVGMGRLGGEETSYPSDADVLFVYEPAPGVPDDVAAGSALAVAEEVRRLLSRPAPDPPLGVDADLRPEGRQGPLVRSLSAYRQYYLRWSKIWEAQALLRARFVAGDAELGERFLALADTIRFPADGLSRDQIVEIRRIKARVDNERLPRGADPATHTKLGRGGLADIEWTVQLLQLRHGHRMPALRTTRTLEALTEAQKAGLLDRADATAMEAAWRQASCVRNALTLVRGRASDQLPRQGTDLAAVARILGGDAPIGGRGALARDAEDARGARRTGRGRNLLPGITAPVILPGHAPLTSHGVEPGEFVDDYLRTARRGRQAVDHVWESS